ncbi:TPA: hypothetical protein H1005_03165 [archaeon]|nr:hypothetical protein [Candidatus Naiadarchaeales archaeon SRR2090153.bin1042]
MVEKYGRAYKDKDSEKVSAILEQWYKSLGALRHLPRPEKVDTFKQQVWEKFLKLYREVYTEILGANEEIINSSKSVKERHKSSADHSETMAEKTTVINLAEKDIASLMKFAIDFVRVEYTSKVFGFLRKVLSPRHLADTDKMVDYYVEPYNAALQEVRKKPLLGGDRARHFSNFLTDLTEKGIPGLLITIRAEAARADSRSQALLPELATLRKKVETYEYTSKYYEILLELAMMQHLSSLTDPDIKALVALDDTVAALQEEIDKAVKITAGESPRKGLSQDLIGILRDLEGPRR